MVGERHGLFLVVGDMDKGGADLLLDGLQLILHLAAELEIERAQRLIEKQHGGLDDKGAGEGHALALAAGKLVRLLVEGLREADDRSASWARRSRSLLTTPLMRRPKPTLLPTFICGNSA